MLLQLSISIVYFQNEALADEPRRPHIILMMADQQRQDSIGAYPGSGAVTPNLDSLAADGILFTNAWSSTPSCTPARAAILTGFVFGLVWIMCLRFCNIINEDVIRFCRYSNTLFD